DHDPLGPDLVGDAVHPRALVLLWPALSAGRGGGGLLPGDDPVPDVLVPGRVPVADDRPVHDGAGGRGGDRESALGLADGSRAGGDGGLAVAFPDGGPALPRAGPGRVAPAARGSLDRPLAERRGAGVAGGAARRGAGRAGARGAVDGRPGAVPSAGAGALPALLPALHGRLWPGHVPAPGRARGADRPDQHPAGAARLAALAAGGGRDAALVASFGPDGGASMARRAAGLDRGGRAGPGRARVAAGGGVRLPGARGGGPLVVEPAVLEHADRLPERRRRGGRNRADQFDRQPGRLRGAEADGAAARGYGDPYGGA